MIKAVSLDLNGTLTLNHTMMGLLERELPNYISCNPYYTKYVSNEISISEILEVIRRAFRNQMDGYIDIREALNIAGIWTAGVSLRQTIEYVIDHVEPIEGVVSSIQEFRKRGIISVLNSTGYQEMIHAFAVYREIPIDGYIANRLFFANEDGQLSKENVRGLIDDFFDSRDKRKDSVYDRTRATGKIGMVDPQRLNDPPQKEYGKHVLFENYLRLHHGGVCLSDGVHVDDTMGGFQGLIGMAQAGGIAIAFNYNNSLEQNLRKWSREVHPNIAQNIHFVYPKGQRPNFSEPAEIILRSIG